VGFFFTDSGAIPYIQYDEIAVNLMAFRNLYKTTPRRGAWLIVLTLLGAMRFLLCAAEVMPPPIQLAITGMSADETNLLLTASVPAGLDKVTLETRPALTAPWEEVQQLSAPAGGGELTFVCPQTSDLARFFRLRADQAVQAPSVPNDSSQLQVHPVPKPPSIVSSELEFVATSSLSAHLTNGNAVFHFKGKVDGSDKILITHDGALWNHVNWAYPSEPVAINETQWNPRTKNYLSVIAPGKFLPESFSLESVDLEVIKGRDVVALERTNNGLLIYLDDTPVQAAEYEFNINFHAAGPKPAAAAHPSAAARLNISAYVSGSDRIKITAQEAVLEHKFWNLPSDLTVNGIAWDPRQSRVLKNEGATKFLPDGVDFSTARIVSRKGRDLATAWGEKDALWVRFADNPNGSDTYEIEIAFGPE
jgi:hypothetical protein